MAAHTVNTLKTTDSLKTFCIYDRKEKPPAYNLDHLDQWSAAFSVKGRRESIYFRLSGPTGLCDIPYFLLLPLLLFCFVLLFFGLLSF